ncbi:MAG: hypothetical protein AAFP69_18970 [Planctomycetota bacterium]
MSTTLFLKQWGVSATFLLEQRGVAAASTTFLGEQTFQQSTATGFCSLGAGHNGADHDRKCGDAADQNT